jgi:hypothetical protein
LIGALAAAPVFARGEDQRRRSGSDRRGEQATEQRSRGGDGRQGAERAVPRERAPEQQRDNVQRQNQEQRQNESQRQYQAQRQNESQRQYQGQRQNESQYQAQRQYDARRDYQGQRQYDARRDYDRRDYDRRDYDRRDNQRPYYSNRGGYGYGSRTVIVPRYIRPRIVTIVPYRPYVYRPSFGIGVYYGASGSYPYGYTPRGYYDPIPGRIYGGLRIVDAPREAQVFADGYYIGIVNDFDGVFQHANLEAGTHRIEIEAPGYESVEFDVMVQPGRTITFNADMYRY